MANWFTLLVLAMALTLASACKKSANSGAAGGEDAAAVQAAQSLPEGTNVLAALNQKDYDGAVAALSKIQQSIGEGDQQSQFMTLKQYVRSALLTASATDPKANDALSGLRMMTQGR